MAISTPAVPKAFIWRRIHSLMGLWLVLFLIEHLLTNSQAALWLGENGRGFVRMVNALHNLPYLQAIEIFLIGVPVFIHLIWGVKYALTAKFNSSRTDGSKPALPEYGRNKAYTWQRITSWILLIGIIGHVAKFRFIEYPSRASLGDSYAYFIAVGLDSGLYTLADQLRVELYDQKAVDVQVEELKTRHAEASALEAVQQILSHEDVHAKRQFDEQKALLFTIAQKYKERVEWTQTLAEVHLKPGEVVAVCKDFGTATLLAVRDVFKSPIYVVLYTIFVFAACFHAFNGLWTFLLTWGWILKRSAQLSMVTFCLVLMGIITLLGLAAIWGSYLSTFTYTGINI